MSDPSDEKAPQQVGPDTPDSNADAREKRQDVEEEAHEAGQREFDAGEK